MASVLLNVYQRNFEQRPHSTLAFTGGILSSISDIIAQTVQIKTQKDHDPPLRYEPIRTLRFFTYGLCISPIMGRWNHFLEYRFPLRSGQNAKPSLSSLAKRVASDQSFMAPLGLVAFFGSMSVMEGQDFPHLREKFENVYWSTLVANWKVWPAIQVINFRFMPLPYRVPFNMTCGIGWTLFLSLVNSEEVKVEKTGDSLKETLDS